MRTKNTSSYLIYCTTEALRLNTCHGRGLKMLIQVPDYMGDQALAKFLPESRHRV